MTRKDPEAYRTISEAAGELDLPAHVLRFWESRFSQIKPVKRAGGRRLYRPSDLQLLRGIRALLYEQGYTIKGAQKYLRENGVAAVAQIGAAEGGAPDVQPIADRFVPAPSAADGNTPFAAVIGRLKAAKTRLDEALASRQSD
ncbi:MerR family transcriptional regulator [Hyphobacterium sp.]|uniref:MerR family transcriptional regulator n=1 Tax=Hyphobacterium sp. TaxID=2004662 RepID=UPI003BABD254